MRSCEPSQKGLVPDCPQRQSFVLAPRTTAPPVPFKANGPEISTEAFGRGCATWRRGLPRRAAGPESAEAPREVPEPLALPPALVGMHAGLGTLPAAQRERVCRTRAAGRL